MNTDRIMQDIRKQITAKQNEIIQELRQFVEQQYCATHGRFAEFEGMDGELGSEDGAQIRFSTCCAELRESVQEALSTRNED